MRTTTLVTAGLLLASVTSAQNAPQAGQRTIVTVDKTGVYDRVDNGTIVTKPPTDRAMLSKSSTRWRWQNPNSTNQAWIVRSVGAGQGGTLAWLGHMLNGEQVSVVSTTENNTPPKPVYVTSTLPDDVYVAAADKAPFAVLAYRKNGRVDYHSAFQKTALFSVTHMTLNSGPVEIAMSDQGRRFAVGYSLTSTSCVALVYDASSATPTKPIATFGVKGTGKGFRHIDISADGTHVLLATHTSNHLFDIKANKEVHTAATVSHDAHSVNKDGTVWARGGFDIGAWVKSGTTYKRVVSFKDTSLNFMVATACDVSADGSTFVVAAYDARSSATMHVYCYDLASSPAKLLWTYKVAGGGSFQNSPRAVSVSDDGLWIAVGAWGAASNGQPEALLFNRKIGKLPVGGVDSPGSCFDVDLSGDGQFLIVGTKAVHANTFGRGGSGYCYDRGAQGQWVSGTPSVGRTITLNVEGNKGDVVLQAVSAGLGTPLTLPGIGGTLDLDLSKLLLPPSIIGVIPTGGVLSLSIKVPTTTPSLVGFTVFSQTLRGGTSPMFQNWLQVPITP